MKIKRNMGGSFLHRLAISVLGISDEISEIIDRLPSDGSALFVAREAIGASKHSDHPVIFFMDDMTVMHYNRSIATSISDVRNQVTGERIRGRNEIVKAGTSLNCLSLREIFTMLELLVSKLVHFCLENGDPSYKFSDVGCGRDEGHRKRLTRLRDYELVNNAVFDLLDRLYEVRCEFAHTIQSIDQIQYKGVPLARSFGASGTSRDPTVARFFIDDVFCVSEVLLGIFKPHQSKQLISDRFAASLRTEILSHFRSPD